MGALRNNINVSIQVGAVSGREPAAAAFQMWKPCRHCGLLTQPSRYNRYAAYRTHPALPTAVRLGSRRNQRAPPLQAARHALVELLDVLRVPASPQYLEAWLGGNGCVPLHNLMEDAATAEIRWEEAASCCCSSCNLVGRWAHYCPPIQDAPPTHPPFCSRASVWQWVRYGVRLDDGQALTADRVCVEIQRELDELRQQVGLDMVYNID